MASYYLGADLGGTKTHILITDENGAPLGFGESGPGNHEVVGYAGMQAALHSAYADAIHSAGLSPAQICGAGFGVAGYDWESEREISLHIIGTLGLKIPMEAVNDCILGLLAGSSTGWGVAVVSGTGCNCWGWDAARQHIGRVTGGGGDMGEAAGGGDLVVAAIRAISHQWAQRGPATALTPAFVKLAGARDLAHLLEGLNTGVFHLDAAAAPLVFQVAAAGDPVAVGLVRWAGRELGELAGCVIRQLGFQDLEFEVVLVGSLYDGSPLLEKVMAETIHPFAARARLVRLTASPVIGAVLLGMEAAGHPITPAIRQRLAQVKINGQAAALRNGIR